jgi:hypothetical protein
MHVSQVWCDGESFVCTVFFFEELNTASINFQLHGMLVGWPPFEEPRNKASQPLVPAGSFCQAVPYCPCNWAEDSELLLLVSFFFFLLACYSCLGSTPVRSNRRAASDFAGMVFMSHSYGIYNHSCWLFYRHSPKLFLMLCLSNPGQVSSLHSTQQRFITMRINLQCHAVPLSFCFSYCGQWQLQYSVHIYTRRLDSVAAIAAGALWKFKVGFQRDPMHIYYVFSPSYNLFWQFAIMYTKYSSQCSHASDQDPSTKPNAREREREIYIYSSHLHKVT